MNRVQPIGRLGTEPRGGVANGNVSNNICDVDWGRVFLDTELGFGIDPQVAAHDQIRNSRRFAQAILGAA